MPSKFLFICLLAAAALPHLSLAQSDSPTASSAEAKIKSALLAGHAAVSSVQGAQATDSAAAAVSAYIATAIPSNKYTKQTADFAPIDYPLTTELPASLAAYESSAIAAQSSAYYAQVTPVLSQWESLFSGGVSSLSSVLATESFVTEATTTGAATASATSSGAAAAGVTMAAGRVVAVAAGVVVGGFGVVAAL